MAHNSTIRQKVGICHMCPDNTEKPLIGDLCGNHYWESVRLKSVNKQLQKTPSNEDSFPDLIKELDALVSRYVRMSRADKDDMSRCFTCGVKSRWQELQCGHFIKRGNNYLRFDLRNLRPCCAVCNCMKDGNLLMFARNLNLETPGIVDILIEESTIVYHYSRSELKDMINDFSRKIKLLKT